MTFSTFTMVHGLGEDLKRSASLALLRTFGLMAISLVEPDTPMAPSESLMPPVEEIYERWLAMKSPQNGELAQHIHDFHSWVDDLVAPWAEIPDSSALEPLLMAFQRIHGEIGGVAATSDNTIAGSGPISTKLSKIQDNMDGMRGKAASAFKGKFLVYLPSTVGNLSAVTLSLMSAVAAEQGMWKGLNIDLTQILADGKTAFDAIDGSGSDITEWKQVAAMGIAIGEAISLIPHPVAVIGIALAGFSAFGAAQLESTTPPHTATISEVRSQIDRLEGDLRDRLVRFEKELADALRGNLASMENNPGQFDLSLPLILPTSDDHIAISDPGLVEDVSFMYLPSIRDSLLLASQWIESEDLGTAISRPSKFGVGATGPSPEYNDLARLTARLLNNLSEEVNVAAKNLELALSDLLDADDSGRKELEQMAESADINPWVPASQVERVFDFTTMLSGT